MHRPIDAAQDRSGGTLRSLALITVAWLILQFGGLFSPGLLDDVDSVYIEVAREMLHRHDFVTPYVDGIRFFDKPPLLYWLAAASMRLFGEYDWAARLPLALAMLALLFAVYALALRLYAPSSRGAPANRGALYASLVLATAIGPYLYTRFFIPDLLIALWMTLSIHLFLVALDRAAQDCEVAAKGHLGEIAQSGVDHLRHRSRGALIPSLLLGAVLALNLLTKGLIGLIFPIAFMALYLLLTRQLRVLSKLHLLASAMVFLAIAMPWHILAALRNPAIAMPVGSGLPARAGWTWFYLYNEHVARFLGRRVPHDYGQTPIWLFWIFAILWIMPWGAFLPAAFATLRNHLGHRLPVTVRQREAALVVTLWVSIVLIFFTLSSRQEYYSLPALPALALLVGGLLAAADEGEPFRARERGEQTPSMKSSVGKIPANTRAARNVLLCHRWLLLPLTSAIAVTCAYFAFTAPQPAPGADLAALLETHPELYNVSLGHVLDLTAAAMGFLRGPLITVAAGMLILGFVSYMLRRGRHTFSANLTLAAGMVMVLLAAHEALIRFNPILGSKALAQAILSEQAARPQPGDMIVIDGELTSGSTLLFYTRQPVHLVNGRINGPWFGSFWPDAPAIFETDATLPELWSSPHRVFLLTYSPHRRVPSLESQAPTRILASSGGKTILTNR